jgi:hypothetical protein
MRKQASPATVTEQRRGTAARPLTALSDDNASAVLALINRVALDACADVEKLDRVNAVMPDDLD